MADENAVHKIREFNRTYLPTMGLLGNSYLNSGYSATEARVLFEVHTRPGCTASHIAQTFKVDKSHLSRIVSAHERAGLIRREPDPADARSQRLFLTGEGELRAQELIARSDEEIGGVIAPLTASEQALLADALTLVEDLLTVAESRRGEQRS